MNAVGVYSDKQYPIVGSLNFRIGSYANELSACERLLKMGYSQSNGINLDRRAEWLENEISRLEDQRNSLKRQYERMKQEAMNREAFIQLMKLALLIGLTEYLSKPK